MAYAHAPPNQIYDDCTKRYPFELNGLKVIGGKKKLFLIFYIVGEKKNNNNTKLYKLFFGDPKDLNTKFHSDYIKNELK